MVISQPPGNNPSYYYRASPTLPQFITDGQRHLMFYTCNYNIRVTHRNGAIKHIFTRIRSTEGSSADCSLFILSLHACLHLAVKILLQIFLYEDLSTLALHTSVSFIFPSRMPAGPVAHFCMLLSENILIFDINHQQNTGGSDQIETIKTIMQTARPSYHMEEFYQWLRFAIFKEIFDQVRKI